MGIIAWGPHAYIENKIIKWAPIELEALLQNISAFNVFYREKENDLPHHTKAWRSMVWYLWGDEEFLERGAGVKCYGREILVLTKSNGWCFLQQDSLSHIVFFTTRQTRENNYFGKLYCLRLNADTGELQLALPKHSRRPVGLRSTLCPVLTTLLDKLAKKFLVSLQ